MADHVLKGEWQSHKVMVVVASANFQPDGKIMLDVVNGVVQAKRIPPVGAEITMIGTIIPSNDPPFLLLSLEETSGSHKGTEYLGYLTIDTSTGKKVLCGLFQLPGENASPEAGEHGHKQLVAQDNGVWVATHP